MFKTLQDLVTHYQRDADGLVVILKKPCVMAPIDVSEQIIIPTDVSGQIVDEWQTDRSGIRLVGKLMCGESTEVWEGIWNDTTPVAVNTHKPNKNMTVNDFLKSVAAMKKLQHPKLVKLYAVCSMEKPVFIITELMKHGSLLDYLHGEEIRRSLKLHQLIDMASQVAAGMTYLEEQNVIHRDLAARNIQVGEDKLLCKVANFELARVIDRDVYEGQKREKIAIKWAAPEAALYNIFNIKSDIWSFGTVLYEIVTYGGPPYPGMTDDEVADKIEQGYRMPKPLDYGCPEKLYHMMLNCWQVSPNDRPTFAILQWKLEELFTSNKNL
jgi:fyn-related kinase